MRTGAQEPETLGGRTGDRGFKIRQICLPLRSLEGPSIEFDSHQASLGGSDGKESTCNAGDLGSIPGLGRFPGEGNVYTFQYSCLEKPMDRRAWQASPWGHKELDTTE